MPELPEVEVTRRGIEPHVLGRTIASVTVREPRLRWRVPAAVHALAGREVRAVKRRGKYLLLDCGDGHLILHLGMSGSLRLVPLDEAPGKHDHVDICFDRQILRLRDPRRFGAMLWTDGPPEAHPLIRHLGLEPLSAALDGPRLHALTRAQPRADQAVPDGWPARRRRRQHLRRGKPVSRRHRAAQAGGPAVGAKLRAPRSGDQAARCARQSAPAAPRCATSSAATACMVASSMRAWVYDRAGQACRKCGGADPPHRPGAAGDLLLSGVPALSRPEQG